MRHPARLVSAFVLAMLPLAFAPSAAAASGERITSYDVVLEVASSGDLLVQETIGYDFADAQDKHGLFRKIPTRVPFDKDTDRVYRIHDIRVSSPTGAPSDVQRSESSGYTQLRIGNPDRTVTGRQTYDIRYRVEGALNNFSDHVELYWNAMGPEWEVPIDKPTVRVVLPGPIVRQACFAGYAGSTLPCATTTPAKPANEVTYTQPEGLPEFGAFTVVIGMAPGTVTATGPVLEKRYSLARAVLPSPATGSLAGLILVTGAGGSLWMLGTRGRDRRYAGQTPGLMPGNTQSADEEATPLIGREPVAVQFQPPEGLRPGQMGTLIDEQANVLDVTATIVDLAVRGYLRIEEIPRTGWFSSRDWLLVKLPEDAAQLLPYERKLYDSLFKGREQVLLGQLKQTFSTELGNIQDALYDDVTKARWFRGRPDKVRSFWQNIGFFLAFGGGWLTFSLVKHEHWAPVGAAVMIVGAIVWLVSRRMAARTARGSALLIQALGFREYIRTAEANQLRFEESQDIFSRYLPYAVVFGESERWVKVFASLGAVNQVGTGTSWYVGPNGWDPGSFSDSLNGFTTSTSGAMAAATPSSSGGSGFGGGGSSGGGGGGGGGGSW